MRLTILALLLSTGTAAFCQSTPSAPANPYQPLLALPGATQVGRDSTKLPPDWHITSLMPRKMEILPGAWPLHPSDGPQIDAQIIVHPPPSSLGEQPQSTMLAQNLYPGLQLLPVDESKLDESKLKAQPIPIAWPNLKVENIPIVWPQTQIKPVEIKPAEGSATGSTSPK